MRRLKSVLIMMLCLMLGLPVLAATAKTPTQITLCEELQPAYNFNGNYRGGIAYNGDYYLYISGHYNEVYRSYNQIAWERVANFNEYVVNLLWDGKQFVALTKKGVATSINGIDWAYVEVPAISSELGFSPSDMVYTGSLYCFTGSKAPLEKSGFYFSDGIYYYSYDLKTFYKAEEKNIEKVVFGFNRPTERLIWNGKTLLAVGNTMAQSTNGKTWDGSIASKAGNFNWDSNDMIWDGKKYVDTQGRTSLDAITWTNPTTPIQGEVIGFNGKEYLIVCKGQNNVFTYYYSKDAKTWEKNTLNLKTTIITTVYGTEDGFILGGNNIIHLKTTAPFKTTTEIAFNDSIQVYMNNQPIGKQGAFKLASTTYMPVRTLIDNKLVSFEKQSDGYKMTDLTSQITHKFAETDFLQMNNRLYVGVGKLSSAFGYDLHVVDKDIYFSTRQNIKFSELEKGKTYVATGNLTQNQASEVVIKGSLDHYPDNLAYDEMKVVYGGIGTALYENGPVLKQFYWNGYVDDGIGCDLDQVPEKVSGGYFTKQESVKLMYVKDNQVVDPYPMTYFRSQEKYVLSSFGDGEQFKAADQWLLFFYESNSILVIDVPDFSQFEVRPF